MFGGQAGTIPYQGLETQDLQTNIGRDDRPGLHLFWLSHGVRLFSVLSSEAVC